jgi:hypothetical protein
MATAASTATKLGIINLKMLRDLSWASSSAFILDGAKINLPSGKKSLALSAYPVESDGNGAWDVLEYTKSSLRIILKDGLSIRIQWQQT